MHRARDDPSPRAPPRSDPSEPRRQAGVGATLRLTLNAEEDHPKSEKLEVEGKVLAVSEDGVFYPKLGTSAGKKDTLGPCASFEIAGSGIKIILKSLRVQCRRCARRRARPAAPVPHLPRGGHAGLLLLELHRDPQARGQVVRELTPPRGRDSFDDFTFMAIDPYAARSIVVKSSIHYRAGFRHVFPLERIIEIETAGLTSSNHATLPWARIPRPFYPLDRDTEWAPPPEVKEL